MVFGELLYCRYSTWWGELAQINSAAFPWLIVGDFNCTLSPSRGGRDFDDSISSRAFYDFLFNQGLVDLSGLHWD